jgi:BirA family transcriptional regulator, biotin operon repressor / biotin---[acetyl-CoA-carboxylase] ligase
MIGHPRVHWRLTDSTNERARELALTGASHGTLVTADEQTAGRGRQGRSWVAPPGRALLMSVVVEIDRSAALLPLAAAVAVCDACESVAAVECAVKWPNDVWIDRRKVAGILVEGRPQEGWAILGIGVNVATAEDELPEELRHTATSLAAASGDAPARDAVLAELLPALERRLAEPPAELLAAWRERDALRGSPVRWEDGDGVAAGIDDDGALLVDTASGDRVALGAGEVHLR